MESLYFQPPHNEELLVAQTELVSAVDSVMARTPYVLHWDTHNKPYKAFGLENDIVLLDSKDDPTEGRQHLTLIIARRARILITRTKVSDEENLVAITFVGEQSKAKASERLAEQVINYARQLDQ